MRPKILQLLLFFILFYFLDHFTEIFKNSGNEEWIEMSLKKLVNTFISGTFLVFALDTVFTYLLFYKFYPTKGIIFTVIFYLLIAVPAMIGLRFVIEEVIIFSFTGRHNYSLSHLTPKYYIKDNIYFTLYFNFVAIVFFGVQYERYTKMRKQALKLQARNAELSFLKSQINPHFLFNNLNSIYALVYQKSTNALPAISKLSELLRYMLYQKENEVLLREEIKYLHNFIDLQLMRYDFSPNLEVSIQEIHDENFTILPLTLIPFIENAFKHGDLRDAAHPMRIDLKIQEHWLYLTVYNKKNRLRRDESGGIGLENVKKRLELLKPNQFDLQINDDNEHFNVELKMKIHGQNA